MPRVATAAAAVAAAVSDVGGDPGPGSSTTLPYPSRNKPRAIVEGTMLGS